jgi:YegS/Rv2252/BmrU family lipid kinase
MEREKIVFIVNPKSGVNKKQRILKQLASDLDKRFVYEIKQTERPAHATELAKEAIQEGAVAVVAIGGDGTVNEVAKGLIHTKTALGVIPAGSGNGFARHLKIPMQIKAAIRKINAFQKQTIDSATINGEAFLATAGLGFDAHVGWKFANFGHRGFFSYMQVTTNEFFRFKPRIYELEVDGIKMETSAFLINIANAGQYGNNAWIAPSASISDGKLNLCILEKFPHYEAPEIIFRLFSKQIEQSKYYKVIRAKEVRIKKPDRFHMDGEPRESVEDIMIRVVPDSLEVIA